jgi:hypothetical protein
MRIIIFIVFIMMIIIFLNELKNISASFFQINYIKDVADINIKKHCNDIYCEAETGRFNIAKNSYKLLLPNDFYNTKTYYFTICITIIKNIPYIFAFLTLVLIIVTFVARYAPTESVGYRNYFNIDNPVVSDFDKVLNINGIYNYILLTIATIFLAYYFSTAMCNKYIYTYPLGANKLAIINQNMSMGYLIITIFLTYLLLNIMNILLSFADNKYPKLNNNNYRDIITKNYNKVLIENVELKREKVLADCYTNTLSTTDVTNAKTKANGYGHDIMYSKDNKEENRSYGITTHHNTVGSATKFHAVLYTGIDYISNIDHADDYDIADIKVNYYFKYISPLIPFAKIKDLADTNKNKRYGDSYGYNYTLYETNIHSLKNDSQPDTIIKNYKDNPLASYNAYYMIDNLRIGLFNTTTEDDYNDADYKTNLNQILKLFSYIKPTSATTAATATVLDARNIILNKVFKERYEVLLNVLIYFCINEINYWNTYTSKKIYDNENSSNYEYINDVIYPDYEKHTILLNLIKYLKDQKANSEKITKDAMLSTTTVTNLKNNLIREIIAYSRYKKDSQKDKKPFFGKEYNILSNITEIKDNFTADISYGSANTFYEQYFNISNNDVSNISNNDVSANDIEYKIGNYFINDILI